MMKNARMKKSFPLKINHLQYNSLLLELQNSMVKKSFMEMSVLFSNKLDLSFVMNQLNKKITWSIFYVIR